LVLYKSSKAVSTMAVVSYPYSYDAVGNEANGSIQQNMVKKLVEFACPNGSVHGTAVHSKLMVQATSQVFLIYEILEQILLHCVSFEHTLLDSTSEVNERSTSKTQLWDHGSGIVFLLVSGRRVAKFWHEMISKLSSIQLQRAMFFSPKPYPIGFTLNPLITRIIKDVTSAQESSHPARTWHDMLLVDTLEPQVFLQGKSYFGGSYCDDHNVCFAGNVRMDVFATWILKPAFAISWQKVPIIVMERANCMKRGEGEISYDRVVSRG
jgi:hypothetical protein